MDFKSILIGGLGTALLFVSIGAGVQSESTTIQVTENPYPYEVVDFVSVMGKTRKALLNRETGDLEFIYATHAPKGESGDEYILQSKDFKRHQ